MTKQEVKVRELTDLDKYRLKNKWSNLGKISWQVLVYFSYLVIGFFIGQTIKTFWTNIAIKYPQLSHFIGLMFLIVTICLGIILIDLLRRKL